MRITCVTGSRADRANLTPVIKALDAMWVVIDPNPSIDTLDTATSTGKAVIETAEKLVRTDPELVVLLGDRFEILGAATAANILGLPIAHLSGGDITEGSQDDCFRHAITKLSHLHFATHEESAQRIIQMGENPSRVHVVGCPGIDRLMQTPLMTKEQALFGTVYEQFILVCLHPTDNLVAELSSLSDALKQMRNDIGVVFIGPNSDAGNKIIIDEWKLLYHNQRVYCPELETQRYLSLMKHCDVMVGNSSAGLYEAPSFGTPVINIGDRQKGRIKAPCVMDVEPDTREILVSIKIALEKGHVGSCNPYGDGHACERIVKIIGSVDPKSLLCKRFHYVGSRMGKDTPEQDVGYMPGAGNGPLHNAALWTDTGAFKYQSH